jgi:hypothetical protein
MISQKEEMRTGTESLSTWEISPSNDTEDRDTIDGGKVEQCSRMSGRYRQKDRHILIRVGLDALNRFLWVYYLLDSVRLVIPHTILTIYHLINNHIVHLQCIPH